MIRLENTVTPSPEQWVSIIMGARNPMNSWDKSDTKILEDYDVNLCKHQTLIDIGPNDRDLMMRLRNAGSDHRKFMRMIVVYVDITAPLYWWKEFDTYKVGTVANSCSTMHKIHDKEFTLEDFSTEHLYLDSEMMLNKVISGLNEYRADYISKKKESDPEAKEYWWQLIQMLPSSYSQKRTIMMSYETLCNMYAARKNHKLDEWRKLCEWIEGLPFSELITGNSDKEEKPKEDSTCSH